MPEPFTASDAAPSRMVTLKYSGASLCGFAADLALLKLLTHAGVAPAWARLASLFVAMQVTFCINGFLVFRTLEVSRIHRQWAAYMATNAVGNVVNYLTFTTLLSLHRPWVSNHVVAVCAGAFIAWTMNYTFTRLLVFHPRLHRWIDAIAGACRMRGDRPTPNDATLTRVTDRKLGAH